MKWLMVCLFLCLNITNALASDTDDKGKKNKDSKESVSLSEDLLPELPLDVQLGILMDQVAIPPEIRKQIKNLKDRQLKAESEPVRSYVEQNIVTSLLLKPGSVSPKISLEPTKFSTLLFVDSSGEPWRISYAKSSNDVFKIINDENFTGENRDSTNSIVLFTEQPYQRANIVVGLEGLDKPILVDVDSTSQTIDRIRTLKVIGAINQSDTNSVSKEIPTINSYEPVLEKFLIEPVKGSEVIPTTNRNVQVWRLNGDYFIRTNLELIGQYSNVDFGGNDWRVYKIFGSRMLDQIKFISNGEIMTVDVMIGK